MKGRLLLISSVWPEPQSSAAGVRDRQLIDLFFREGWDVVVASPSKPNDAFHELKGMDISVHWTPANDDLFDQFLEDAHPDVVIFDRFVMEEQFGWRVHSVLPQALRVVDTQDLHFVREAREKAVEAGLEGRAVKDITFDRHGSSLARELASLYRSDLSLLVSTWERDLLLEKFQFPAHKLALFSFAYPEPPAPVALEKRKNFYTIGNFRHLPNRDAFFWVRQAIWPEIRARLPEAEFHIYGAYPPKWAMEAQQSLMGFHVCGPAHATSELESYRACLAPLRFGAGIKGKIAEAWWLGTPVVTTDIGAEGMMEKDLFGGLVTQGPVEFVEAAVRLYTDDQEWTTQAQNAKTVLSRKFLEQSTAPALFHAIDDALRLRDLRRSQDHIASILWHQSHRSTEYFSRWIELKNRFGFDFSPTESHISN